VTETFPPLGWDWSGMSMLGDFPPIYQDFVKHLIASLYGLAMALDHRAAFRTPGCYCHDLFVWKFIDTFQ
jgi:hypothetical protein